MLPGAAREILGDKDALHKSLQSAKMVYGENELKDFVLKSYFIKSKTDILDFLSENKQRKENAWIIKETRSWSGAGVNRLA